MSNNLINKNRTDAVLADVADYSHFQYAKLYHQFNKTKYLYSDKTGWYSYDDFNVLVSHKKEPTGILNDIAEFLSKYIQDEMNSLNVVDDTAKKHFDKLFKAFNRVSTSTFINGIIPLLPALFLDKELDDKIDANLSLFSFKNKVYDIVEGSLRDIEKNDYILRTTGYNAPKKVKNFSLIDDLVNSIFEDKEVSEYFLTVTAMTLFTNKYEKLYILTGNGRNGKGVLSSIISKALGNYYLTGANDLLTIKDESKNETLAKATGIRYLAISEPAEDNDKETKFNISMVKKLTGRDVISTRALYKNSFEYVPQFTMFVSCNKQPAVDETNEAIRNRFRFIHFPFTFVDNPTKKHERLLNVNLKDEIDNDTKYRDTMIWYLLHLVSNNHNIEKIKEPAKCKEFTKTYFDNNDDVANFLEKYFEITENPKDKIRPTDIYQMYSSDGDYKKLSTVKFADGLKASNIEKHKISGNMYYFGLKKKVLKPDNEDSEAEDDNETATEQKKKKNPLDLE